MKRKVMSMLGIVLLSFVFVLAGCSGGTSDTSQSSSSVAQGETLANSGTLVLKVNPEIAIDYDEDGKVTAVRGMNSDGVEIVKDYPDFIGKDSGVVLEELIGLIGEAGYFVEEVEGEAKKIVIELESGSVLPGDNFLEAMAANAQGAVETYKLNSDVTFDGNTYISLDEAKEIAFDHAKVDGAKAKFDDQELDTDDGVPSYELEFEIDGNEYEYDIHAVSGEVLDFEQDIKNKAQKSKPATSNGKNDDSGYDDSAYGNTATQKPAAPAKKSAPAQKPAAKPAPKPAAPKQNNQGRSNYDDSDYDDSDYDDSGYDDSGYDDSDYDDSDYDDSDYDDSDYD